jgi:predicted nucleotidyltransferase
MKRLYEALQEIVDLLDALRIKYAIMGGIAVRVHGISRPTQDLDFLIALPTDRLDQFFDSIEELGYSVPESYRRGWVDRVAGMPLVKFRRYLADHGLDIDVFLVDSPIQEEMIKRAQVAEFDNLRARVVSPEDLIILKLMAGRHRDLGDVTDILFMQGRLDEQYLRHWAKELGVADKLEQVLTESREI